MMITDVVLAIYAKRKALAVSPRSFNFRCGVRQWV